MHRFLVPAILLTIFLIASPPTDNVRGYPCPQPDLSTAYELIDAVNLLRAGQGLAAYTSNGTLMNIAQAHAEYLASIGVSNTHIDALGRRPFQRALDAGYLVAGDLSLGGFFSENVVGGVGLSADGAVDIWMGDAAHQNTMLSTSLQDVGAGVAVVGNTYYYVLDAGLSTGGTPVVYTPPPAIIVFTPTFITPTPHPDGSIIHVVRSGDTLLEIALSYNITLQELYALNNLNDNSYIYPDQEIFIRQKFTATPTLPSPTSTMHPTSTLWPTSSNTNTPSVISPTITSPPAAFTTDSTGKAVIKIIIAALVAAAILTMVSVKRKKN